MRHRENRISLRSAKKFDPFEVIIYGSGCQSEESGHSRRRCDLYYCHNNLAETNLMSSLKTTAKSSSKTSGINKIPSRSTATYCVSNEILFGRQRSHPCQTERVRRKHDFIRLIYNRISPNKISFEPKTSRSRETRFCSGQTGFCFAKTNICFSKTPFCSSKTKPVRYQRSFVYPKRSFVSGKQSRF